MLVSVYVNQQAIALDDGVATRLTLPENPLTLSSVRTVCCSEPRGIAWKVGLSKIVKSETPELTVTTTVTDLEMLPLVPVTVA